MKRTSIVIACAMLLGAGFVTAEEAQANWKKHCASCHGQDGSGQTPMGKRLKLKDYRDSAVQGSFTDDEIVTAIKEGVTVDGKVRMKPLGDKMTEEEITALVPYVRSLAE